MQFTNIAYTIPAAIFVVSATGMDHVTVPLFTKPVFCVLKRDKKKKLTFHLQLRLEAVPTPLLWIFYDYPLECHSQP